MKYILVILITIALYQFNYAQNKLSEKPKTTVKSDSNFGNTQEYVNNLAGEIFLLPEHTQKLPDFSKLRSVGKIYTNQLNIHKQPFYKGFPGVTKRVEYFAIQYKGNFYVPESCKMCFSLKSDDGSKLLINDTLVINNDYLHVFKGKENCIELNKGLQKIEVQYFQGPKFDLGLVLQYKIQNEAKYKLFDVVEFSPVDVQETEQLIKVSFKNNILFETNDYSLSKTAKYYIDEVNRILLQKVNYKSIEVVGHTDNVGTNESNVKLSLKRAESVKKYLLSANISADKITLKGAGSQEPVSENTTEKGKQQNRRIELYIHKINKPL